MDHGALTPTFPRVEVPTLVERAGPGARFAFDEFLSGINSPHTARAYARAVKRFLNHAESAGLELHRIPPGFIAEYIRHLPLVNPAEPIRTASKPTRKLHLAAIRLFLDHCVQRHAIVLNPALSVRGPRHSVNEGKTPAIDAQHARELLDSIVTERPIDLRDRVIIATMIFTAARVGAIAKLTVADLFSDGRQRYFHFHEKGDKQRVIPVRHDLDVMLDAYTAATPPRFGGDPLFLSAVGRSGRLTATCMTANDMLRMIKRRLRQAGLRASDLCCHSFRAGTATNLLEQGVDPAEVQYLLGHSDPRTTRLYDRRQLRVSRNIVERIAV